MSDYYREHSLWVFLSMTSSIHAFMRVFMNMSSEMHPTHTDTAMVGKKNYIMVWKCSRNMPESAISKHLFE